MDSFKISLIAESLQEQMEFFNCDMDTAWQDHMPELMTEQVSLRKVKSYMIRAILDILNLYGGPSAESWNRLPLSTKKLFTLKEIEEAWKKGGN